MSLNRRSFLKGAALGGAALGLGGIAPSPAHSHRTQADKKLKILILGGTAFLGPAIVRAARRRGHETHPLQPGTHQRRSVPGHRDHHRRS